MNFYIPSHPQVKNQLKTKYCSETVPVQSWVTFIRVYMSSNRVYCNGFQFNSGIKACSRFYTCGSKCVCILPPHFPLCKEILSSHFLQTGNTYAFYLHDWLILQKSIFTNCPGNNCIFIRCNKNDKVFLLMIVYLSIQTQLDTLVSKDKQHFIGI